jgi:epoxyqueuosine reductase
VSQHSSSLAEQLCAEARVLGLDLVSIVPVAPPTTVDRYRAWLARGFHGEMAYLARPEAAAKREDLAQILPGVRSVVVVALNYHTVPLPSDLRDDPGLGVFASYAWGQDYHDVLARRLHELGAAVAALTGGAASSRAYVDTGPILERDLGARAGLGFVGKNTQLINPRLGSWLFLGELLLTVGLPGEELPAVRGTCGRCTRCLDVCPTGALVAPYLLDARRCISYLTIELKGPIPRELRPHLDHRIFGCDLCQEVCPWNRRFARPTAEPAFQPKPISIAPSLLDLIALDDEGFRLRFQGSPVRRAKRRGLLRSVAVALGNWRSPSAIPALARALHDPEPLIRGHSAWALGRFDAAEPKRALDQALAAEADPWVREELELALSTL